MDGTEDKLKGKFNEVKGKVTGNTGEEYKGKAQQAWGTVENKVNEATDDLNNNADNNPSNTAPAGTPYRDTSEPA